MDVLGALLEGFDDAKHPRGAHGRWIRELNALDPSSRHFADIGGVHVRRGGTGGRLFVTKRYLGTDRTPRETHHGSADEAARYIEQAQPKGEPDRHGGFKIGDVVTHETGSRGAGGHGPVTFTKQPGLSTVVGLQRNGNLRIKHPATGTTHDVHHSHAQKVSPLHPDYRGKVVQDAYAAQRAEIARQAAERARRSGRALGESAFDALLEGFAAAPAEPFPDHDFTTGDQVRVSVGNGARAVTGRVMRPHGGPPPTHAVIAPEGGGAHVLAPVGQVKLNTPAQHAAAQKRQEATQQRQQQQQAHAAWMAAKPAGSKPPGPVREGVEMLLEAFAVAAPGETPAQSQALGAQDVKTAQGQLASGWNAQKHPRAQGGKFGYTTGGKRAKRGQASSSRTLGQGSSGALVKSIQQQVGAKVDGQYGPQTHAAVARYQQQHGLQVDGVVGAQTLASLRGSTNARLVAPGPIKSSQATVRAHPATRKPGKASKASAKASAPAPVRMAGGLVV